MKQYPDGRTALSYYSGHLEIGPNDKTVDRVFDGLSVERKEIENGKRARNVVWDIAQSNIWSWFVTLTFDPKKVDRFDYDSCVKALRAFIKYIYRLGLQYIFVPELHKSGAYHFHGLIAGDLPVVDALYHNKLIYHSGRKLYNIPGYKLGFATASKVGDSNKVGSYLTKYLSKEMACPKGRKRYWVSRGCVRPTVSYFLVDDASFNVPDKPIQFAKSFVRPDGFVVNLFETYDFNLAEWCNGSIQV